MVRLPVIVPDFSFFASRVIVVALNMAIGCLEIWKKLNPFSKSSRFLWFVLMLLVLTKILALADESSLFSLNENMPSILSNLPVV